MTHELQILFRVVRGPVRTKDPIRYGNVFGRFIDGLLEGAVDKFLSSDDRRADVVDPENPTFLGTAARGSTESHFVLGGPPSVYLGAPIRTSVHQPSVGPLSPLLGLRRQSLS